MARGSRTSGNLGGGGRSLRAARPSMGRARPKAPQRPRASRGTQASQMPGVSGRRMPTNPGAVAVSPRVKVTSNAKRMVRPSAVPRVPRPQ